MAMRSPSSPPRRDLVPRDSPQADSLLPTPQGGSGNGARADVARKTKEVDHLLAKLENEGVEIDGKIASIIDDEVARIKAEASREHVNNTKENVMTILLTVASVAVGFIMGAECDYLWMPFCDNLWNNSWYDT
uniref:Uncharacterized protein n=1 Tax=Oryza punctata TaxID=4537 RepID=A0A0E0K117_ORYPU